MGLVVALFALWLALGLWFLIRSGVRGRSFWLCAVALTAALVLRFCCMDHVTYDYRDFLAPWCAFFRDNGGFGAIRLPVGNYNVPDLYFLAAISYLPARDLYLIKLFSIFFDLLLAIAAFRLAGQVYPEKKAAPAAVFCAAVLLPTVILNGAYWGQCDSVYAALVLLALSDALDKRGARSVIWLALAFSFKLQAVFLIPLWCVLWYSGRVKLRHLCLFPAAYAGSILPALLLGKPLKDILSIYLDQAGYYSQLTLNAPSVYAMIPYGREVDEALLSKLGIAAAFLLVLALLGVLFVRRGRRDGLTNEHILTAAVILAIGVPLLLPHMHERYFFLADILSVVWCAGGARRVGVPLAVQTASLGGYHAYLVLRYAFPMAWGAWMLVAALTASFAFLFHSLKEVPETPLFPEEERPVSQ